MALLELRGVTQRFGGLVAVDRLDFAIDRGTIVAMIGPNGAGKSTVFNLITGIYVPTGGSITFDGRPLAGMPPGSNWFARTYGLLRAYGRMTPGLPTSRVAACGIARTFQNIRLFAFMSALDNVMTGEHARMRASLADSLLHTPPQRAEERRVAERARELLAFVGLEAAAEQYARNLPYGSQRKLEIARGLASDPKLLLLDEPAAGMNPKEKSDLIALIRRIRDRGVTVFLIEHDMRLVNEVSERITVLDHGEKIAEGTPDEVRRDPRVIEAYLGAAS